MNRTGLLILVASIAVSIAITMLSGGRFIFIGLPLLFGLPLAGLFGRRRDRSSDQPLAPDPSRAEAPRR